MWPGNKENIVTILQKRAKRKNAHTACIFLAEGEYESDKISYLELDKKARAIAASLQAKNLFNQRVLLLYPAGIDFVCAFIGCLYAGVIAVPITTPKLNDFEQSHALFETIAQDAGISGILTTATYSQKCSDFFKQDILVTDVPLFNVAEKEYRLPIIQQDTVAYLQYTSGSTSTPKGVVVQHKQLTHSLKYTAIVWRYTKKSKTLTWAPHSHVYGLICGLLLPLYHGTPTIIMPTSAFVSKPARWLQMISKYRVTHSGCPNFGYDLCVQEIQDSDLLKVNLANWQVAVNGGENIQDKTLKQFQQKFKRYGFKLRQFCCAFGMSEMVGLIASNPQGKKPTILTLSSVALQNNTVRIAKRKEHALRAVSCGKLLPGLTAVVVDPENRLPVKKMKIGEIWLSGKSKSSAYWQRLEDSALLLNATLSTSATPYLRTGDLGFILNGQLYLTGRSKELIVMHGKKYYPHDLEETIAKALQQFPVGRYCAAITVPIDLQEEVVILQEMAADISKNLQDNIIQLIRNTLLNKYSINPHAIILVAANSLPKTASGKLQRKLCQQHYLTQKLATLSTNNEHNYHFSFQQEVVTLITQILHIDSKQIDLQKPMSTYHFNSINLISLSEQLNQKFNLSITPASLFAYTNLQQFLQDIWQQYHVTLTPRYQKNLIEEQKNLVEKPVVKNNTVPSYAVSDIAVVGMNGIFPGANNLREFWQNLIERYNVISSIPEDRVALHDKSGKINWGGFIKNISHFDADFFNISPHEAELMDPQQRLLLQVIWNAIEDAGYSDETLAANKTGLFIGAFSCDYAELLQQENIIDAYMTTGLSRSLLANRISYLLNLTGPSEVIDTACSSSLVALHQAVLAIQHGDCTIAIVGGVNALLAKTSYLIASDAGMLSIDGQCKTFDKHANGYVRGEGIAALVIKPLVAAEQDKDHIYGIIKGSAVNHGGHASSLTAPNPNAQAEVITAAYQRANVDINTISYIETHGTGTPLGDPIEVDGLKKAFRSLSNSAECIPNSCALGTVKTHIGHLESAAGIAGVIKILLAFHHKKLPGNLHFTELNPYIDFNGSPFYVLQQTEEWQTTTIRRAGVSSFGFGGTNAHVVLEEAISSFNTQALDTIPYLFTLSAKTAEALQSRIHDLQIWLNQQSDSVLLSALAYTLNCGRHHFDHRVAIVAQTVAELHATLQKILTGQSSDNSVINAGKKNAEHIKAIFHALFHNLLNELISNPTREKLLALGNFYTEGCVIDWQKLFYRDKNRLSLPGYPFAGNHYWIPTTKKSLNKISQHARAVTAIDDFKKLVAMQLKIDVNAIDITQPLSELGFDSLAFKQFAEQLEKYYNININPTIFFTYPTVQALSEHLSTTYDAVKNFSSPATNNLQDEPIAIIGMQAYLPDSDDLNIFWQHVLAGHDLIKEVPKERWDWQQYYGDSKKYSDKTNSKWGGFISSIDKFDAGFFNISAREANLMDPQQRLLLEVVWMAIEDAGYSPHTWSGQNIGVFTGSEFNDYQLLIHHSQQLFHGHVATGNSDALLANRISYYFNFHGPSETINTACSSSLVAIHHAVTALQRQECHIAIASGVSLMIDPDTVVITSQMGALSTEGRCKTFDKAANGYVKGEGIAAVVLKPLSQAKQNNDPIYGLIRASAVNHGGKAQSLTAPNAAAQSQLIIDAYRKHNIDPTSISYIETHGTGTELGDPIEIEGLKTAFKTLSTQPQTAYCGLGSVKTNIGHLEPASGIVGMIKVLLALKHEKIPSHLHCHELNPYINLDHSPFYIVNKVIQWPRTILPRRAGVSSFGFGGTNAHIVIEEAPKDETSIPDQSCYLITLSAKEKSSLLQKIIQLHNYITIHLDSIHLMQLSYTLNTGRAHFNERCALVVSSVSHLLDSLSAMIETQALENTLIKKHELSNAAELYQTVIQHPSMMDQEKLSILAELYLNHYPIHWQDIYKDSIPRMSLLPPYPFNKQRYWFDQEFVNTPQQPINYTATPDLQVATITYLKTIFADKLRISSEIIDADSTYEVYGLDSLIGMEIINQLENDLGSISKTLLFEKNTITELAHYLQKIYQTQLLKITNTNDIPIAPQQDATAVTKSSINSANDEPIAIIGMSGAFPLANNVNELWENLLKGKDCITEIPKDRWDYHDYPVTIGETTKYLKYGGFINDIDKFDPLFFNIAPRDAALMDPQERLFLQSCWETLEDANITRDILTRTVKNNVGVFAGVTYNFYPLFIAEEWHKGNRIPLDIQQFSIANRVSYFLNLSGPSFIIDTACSSSLAAIHLACESIAGGECLMALAGGVNLSLHPSKYHFLGSYGFMTELGKCASFAEGGSGYVPGEGVGTVLLKPLSLAKRDKDKIYGVIKASHMNHGGKTSGYTVPNPNAQTELIKITLQKANIDARSINYIEAHGTGTALGDPIEIRGLQDAFEEFTHDKQFCAIGSIKSNIGHLESAAGVSQLIKVLLQLQHKKLVPSIHTEKLNPFIDFAQTAFYVQRELTDWPTFNNHLRRAGISSFGAGGSNAHLIIEEYQSEKISPITPTYQPYIFILSAMDQERLKAYTNKFYAFLVANPQTNIAELCYSLQMGREAMLARMAIIVDSVDEVLTKLNQYITQIEPNITSFWLNSNTSIKKSTLTADYTDYPLLASQWVKGHTIAWEKLYPDKTPQKISLPTYPFAKRRCWIPSTAATKDSLPQSKRLPDDTTDWLYQLHWNKQSLNDLHSIVDGEWLIFADDQMINQLQKQLTCITCIKGDIFKQIDTQLFTIDPDDPQSYLQLITNLPSLSGIIYLWSLEDEPLLYSRLIHLVKALDQSSLLFCLITANNEIQIWQHHLWSFLRIAAAENKNIRPLLIDIDDKSTAEVNTTRILAEIANYASRENHIAYRNEERYVVRLIQYTAEQEAITWQAPESALITGGLGALGGEIAQWLATKGTKYLLLLGHTHLPDRKNWSTITDKALRDKIAVINALEKQGVAVQYTVVDLTNYEKMQQCIFSFETQWQKRINGVFHLAGITTDNISIQDMPDHLTQQVFAIKAQGAYVLHQLFQQKDLNCFVLFSSIAALPYFGLSGLSAYATANAFLDGLATYRHSLGLPAISINWAAWAEKGMSHRYNHSEFLSAMGMSSINITQGLELLNTILCLKPVNIIVFKVIWEKFLTINKDALKLPLFSAFHVFAPHTAVSPKLTLGKEEIRNLIIQVLAEQLTLNIDEINPDMPYQQYGLDSIVGVHFVAALDQHFPNLISPMDLYRYPCINQLTEYIFACYDIESPNKESDEISHLSEQELNDLLASELAELENML